MKWEKLNGEDLENIVAMQIGKCHGVVFSSCGNQGETSLVFIPDCYIEDGEIVAVRELRSVETATEIRLFKGGKL